MNAMRGASLALVVAGLALGASPHFAAAHGDEPHAAPEPSATTAAGVAPGGERHALDATGERFEVVVKNDPIAPGEPATFDVFVSDYATNAPVAGATVELELRRDGKEEWRGSATADSARPGVYRARLDEPGRAGELVLVARIGAAGGDERFALPGFEIGGGSSAAGAASGVFGIRGPFGAAALLASAAIVLIAVVLALRAGARRRAGGAAAIAALALAAATTQAHEGHKEAPTVTGGTLVPGAAVYLSKESQFLLGVRTELARAEVVPRRHRVLGRVTPRGGVDVEITAPQSGRVRFRGSRAPVVGTRVRRGQELGRLEVVDELVLRSPIGGVVTGVHAFHGQIVQPGQKLLTLLDPSVVWVHADVYEADFEKVRDSKTALVSSPAMPDRAHAAKLVTIGAVQGEVPGAVELWFEVPNPDEELKVGALVDVAIELPRTDSGVVVPRSAVFDKDGRTIVFVHTSPERFTARAVELAAGPGERVAILSGLAPGDRVVVRGGYQLLSSPVAGAPEE
jgi:hypothetical protein